MASGSPLDTVWVLLATLLPLAGTGIVLGLAGIVAYHRQTVRTRELSAELVQQMLQRKMTVDEIERVLLAWSQDRDLAQTMLHARKVLAAH
jgi:hypothetical protein